MATPLESTIQNAPIGSYWYPPTFTLPPPKIPRIGGVPDKAASYEWAGLGKDPQSAVYSKIYRSERGYSVAIRESKTDLDNVSLNILSL